MEFWDNNNLLTCYMSGIKDDQPPLYLQDCKK